MIVHLNSQLATMVPIGLAWSCMVPCGPMWFGLVLGPWSYVVRIGPVWFCNILIRPNLLSIIQVDLVCFHMVPYVYGHAWSPMVQDSHTRSSMV